jgi:hypothetical protein
MKAIILNWPINNVGGIVTTTVALIKGLRSLGVETEVLHVNEGYRLKVPAEDTPTMLAGRYMSMRTDPQLDELMDYLNAADVVIFPHPSPHPTKDQKSKIEGGKRWMKVFERLTTKRCVIFQDNMWHKTNAWFAEVAPYVTHILAQQKMFTESAELYPGNRKIDWTYQPMLVDDVPLYTGEREHTLMMHPQWVRWKRHREFLNTLEKSIFHFELYNDGIEYCYLRKEDVFKDFVTDHHREVSARVQQIAEMFATVPHTYIRLRLREIMGGVDYSRRGYTNYTHWEPLAEGSASFCHQDVLDQQNCCLPSEALVVPFTDDTFIQAQKKLLDMSPTEFSERQLFGYEFVRREMTPEAAATKLLEFVS